MDYIPDSRIAYAAFVLLAISVVMHLLGALGELYALLANHGTIAYALLMFLGVSLPLILVGAMVSGLIRPVPSYALLAGLMILPIVAYADVHGFGYLESVTGAELHTHDHHHGHNGHDHAEESAVLTVIEHLEDDPIALVCKLCEGIAAVFFVILAALER